MFIATKSDPALPLNTLSPPTTAPTAAAGELWMNGIGIRTQPVGCLYVHVPFCARKCAYCAFYSETGNAALMERYVDALLREIDRVADQLRPQTVFFGGGTPSLLPVSLWERIFESFQRHRFPPPLECTVECNPATVSLEKARFLRDHGVNRISLGVQSLEEPLLDRLGRIHSRDAVFRSFDLLRRAGFDNINLDLMFAIPGQTLDQWRRTLTEAVALESEHLACYEVIYEEDTPLFAQLAAGQFSLDEDLAAAMYDELLDRAAANDLHQYEIANFARHRAPRTAALPDHACRHNINYWRGGSYFGLGPGASGYVRHVRTRNIANTVRYCDRLEQNQNPVESRDFLTPLARAGEIAAFGLRMTNGWRFDEFQSITGFDLRQFWQAEIDQLVARAWARRDPDGIRLTPRGLRFADAAAASFLLDSSNQGRQ
jgi:oxygen-independent coproporphyrinogen III oxidase